MFRWLEEKLLRRKNMVPSPKNDLEIIQQLIPEILRIPFDHFPPNVFYNLTIETTLPTADHLLKQFVTLTTAIANAEEVLYRGLFRDNAVVRLDDYFIDSANIPMSKERTLQRLIDEICTLNELLPEIEAKSSVAKFNYYMRTLKPIYREIRQLFEALANLHDS